MVMRKYAIAQFDGQFERSTIDLAIVGPDIYAHYQPQRPWLVQRIPVAELDDVPPRLPQPPG
jgi:hypothetical protein